MKNPIVSRVFEELGPRLNFAMREEYARSEGIIAEVRQILDSIESGGGEHVSLDGSELLKERSMRAAILMLKLAITGAFLEDMLHREGN